MPSTTERAAIERELLRLGLTEVILNRETPSATFTLCMISWQLGLRAEAMVKGVANLWQESNVEDEGRQVWKGQAFRVMRACETMAGRGMVEQIVPNLEEFFHDQVCNPIRQFSNSLLVPPQLGSLKQAVLKSHCEGGSIQEHFIQSVKVELSNEQVDPQLLHQQGLAHVNHHLSESPVPPMDGQAQACLWLAIKQECPDTVDSPVWDSVDFRSVLKYWLKCNQRLGPVPMGLAAQLEVDRFELLAYIIKCMGCSQRWLLSATYRRAHFKLLSSSQRLLLVWQRLVGHAITQSQVNALCITTNTIIVRSWEIKHNLRQSKINRISARISQGEESSSLSSLSPLSPLALLCQTPPPSLPPPLMPQSMPLGQVSNHEETVASERNRNSPVQPVVPLPTSFWEAWKERRSLLSSTPFMGLDIENLILLAVY